VSYFRRDGAQSPFLADRLPIYIFPAFAGSGRILLGMALSGITTGIMMHSGVGGEPMFWWLAGVAYISSLILVVSGIYAVNVIPQQHKRPRHPLPSPPPRRPVKPLSEGPIDQARPTEEPQRMTRLGDLLVEEWGLMTPKQLSRAMIEQQNSGDSLVHVLVRMGLITDEGLEKILEMKSAALDPWHDAPRHD